MPIIFEVIKYLIRRFYHETGYVVVAISFVLISLFASSLFIQRAGMNKRGTGSGMGNQYNP